MDVRAPNSDGWHVLSNSPVGMVFGRPGNEHGESYVAQVFMFALEETNDSDELLSLIRKKFEDDADPSRFELIESNLKLSEERGYPCTIVNYVARDKKARTSLLRRDVLLLQVESVYCRHPVRQETGFAIIYSYRGKTMYTNLSVEAQDFIRGVRVPAPGDN